LEAVGELVVGALAAHDLQRDAHRVLLAPDALEAIERAAQRVRALRPVLRFEPPLDELLRDDPAPPEPIAELDVRGAARLIALVGDVGQPRERLVAAVQALGEDRRELARHLARVFLVTLDLDALREELGDAVPLLELLAEVAQTPERVEVFGVALA